MNLIEAIKSRKRYRRKGELGWYDAVPDFSHYVFCTRDVLAEDWELEEKAVEERTVTITREQFDTAWDNALLMIGIKRHRNALAEELGL